MKRFPVTFLFTTLIVWASAQSVTPPEMAYWLQNTDGSTARQYVQGNSTPIAQNWLVNVQQVEYSNDFVYVSSKGIPAYAIGPYLDGNPGGTGEVDYIFQIPRNPEPNTGNITTTRLGQIGVFINGVPLFDWQDGASYSVAQGTDVRGGPGGGPGGGGDRIWNRNAILAENIGFDCAKGHPARDAYHHHQNPQAFNADLALLSNICDVYPSDGLYVLDSTMHSPLIGYAFDGYPIYGAYGYANPMDASSSIQRMEPSYQLRGDIGAVRNNGPAVNVDFPLGWYYEDFEFVDGLGDLDVHNGRFCVTPEYPNGTYAYFATVDENWNSKFPYVIHSYYGVVETDNFTQMGPGNSGTQVTISEPTIIQDPDSIVFSVDTTTGLEESNGLEGLLNIYPNPTSEFIAVQCVGVNYYDIELSLYDMQGKVVAQDILRKGSTLWYLDTRRLYNGQYVLEMSSVRGMVREKILIQR